MCDSASGQDKHTREACDGPRVVAVYGHRRFGIFKPLFELRGEGFVYGGRSYKWSDIENIRRYDSPFWAWLFWSAAPVTYVYLRGGERVVLKGRSLEKEGEKDRVDFWRGRSNAYVELVAVLLAKRANAGSLGS